MAHRPKFGDRYGGNAHFIGALYWRFEKTKETVMPFLIPVLVGIPVLFGGGYVIYHLVH
jgi:hypothetical protein